MIKSLKSTIEKSWESFESADKDILKKCVVEVYQKLGKGELRVCTKEGNRWETHQWIKKAILLSFKISPNIPIEGAPAGSFFYDKVAPKQKGWGKDHFDNAGFRMVPGAVVRDSAYIGRGVILMPSFVNVGAYVDSGTMVDTWSTIGSCAQIGKNCHISGGVGIGGVLEPLQANPVIIEDDCFIGARSEIAEGVIVEKGAVISMGVFIGASTKIIDRQTGEIIYGRVPSYSVVVPGTLPSDDPLKPSLYCAVIVKKVDEKTRSKTSLNELLRDATEN